MRIAYLKKIVADVKYSADAGFPCFRSSATDFGSIPLNEKYNMKLSYTFAVIRSASFVFLTVEQGGSFILFND